MIIIPLLMPLLLSIALHQDNNTTTWITSGFEDFSKGTFDSAGANIYVSRSGRVQMIRTWDINHDGHIDLFFGNSHNLVEYEPSRAYLQDNGGPSFSTRILLPTQHSSSQCVDDLNADGYMDVVVLNSMWVPDPAFRSFIYWGGPEGLTAKYRTSIPTFTAAQAFAADMNDDGLKEIIVVNQGRERFDLNGGCISIYWQTEAGVYPLDHRDDLAVPSLGDADMADVNSDGFADLVFHGTPSGESLGPAAIPVLKAIGSSKETANVFLLPGKKGGFGPLQVLAITGNRTGKPVLMKINGEYHLTMLTKETIDLYPFTGLEVTQPQQIVVSDAKRIAVGNLNADRFDDLVCVRTDDIQCLWGSETGYDPLQALTLPITATDIAIGDLTDDGILDLAVAIYEDGNAYTAQSRVYVNHEKGLNSGRFIKLETSGATEVHIADLNHDGRKDVLFACSIGGYSSLDPPVRVYLGTQDGNYQVGHHYDLPANSAYGGFMADYDDDGFVDLLVANQYDGSHGNETSSIYWGSKDGLNIGRVSNFPTEHATISATADINRDGYLDIVMGAVLGGTTYIYWGSENGFSGNRRQAIKLGDVWGIHLADTDKDGWLDLVYTMPGQNETYILLGDQKGYEADRRITLPMPMGGAGVETADLDGNGWLDLILTGWSNPRKGFIGTNIPSYIWWGCDQGFSAARRTEFLLHGSDHGIAVADLNKDGYLDIVCSNYDQGTSRIFDSYILWGNVECVYSLNNVTRLRQASGLGIMVADCNHDGWLDIAICNHNSGGNHQTFSRLHWNRQGRFTDDDVTLLPTLGPHGSITPDLGNAYTRKLEEAYTSAAFQRQDNQRFKYILWKSENKFGTSIIFKVRSAATRHDLMNAAWVGPDGEDSYFTKTDTSLSMLPTTHRWIQYRAILHTPNGAATPILTQVEIKIDLADQWHNKD